MGTLQSTVAALVLPDITNYNCTDWAAYGLEKPKMTLTVDYTEEVKQNPQTTQKAILMQIRTIQTIQVKLPQKPWTENWFCMWKY